MLQDHCTGISHSHVYCYNIYNFHSHISYSVIRKICSRSSQWSLNCQGDVMLVFHELCK